MTTKKPKRRKNRTTSDPAPPVEPQTTDAGKSSDKQQAALTKALAQQLRDMSGAAYLYGSHAKFVGEGISTDAYVQYIRQFIADCGAPRDPLEGMLLEQLALTHHSIGRLLARSGMTCQAEESTGYAVAAARLAGEFRRSALALSEYRARAYQKLRVVGDRAEPDLDARHKTAGATA